MNNSVQPGCNLTIAAPSGGVTTGLGYLIGSLFCVALSTAAEGVSVAVVTEGVFTLPKTSAQAWTVGQKIYWDNGNSRCDSDGSVGPLIGVATAIAANPSATGSVRLNGTVASTSEGPQAAIADLVAITGGEAPTEAEHNLVVAKVNTILAELRLAGIIAT